ncbi:eh domain-containing protein 2 [Quercus suber]|uniref:Eh domain-containing protein 2 n=1 Tax=Quercus suber TaxID=58331 RepID=A0AAW0IMF7_QUESU
MAGQNPMDQFEVYFRRADLDGDGRISGAEAVSFFQGSNLTKQVLAQIWMHADQSKTGFLGRAEFYNALRLVTVAQSKRELTPDIVKAALYGPAAAKIPPPKINLPATPTPQMNSMVAAPAPQMGPVAPTSSQNLGFRAQGVPNPSMNQHYFPQQNQVIRPPQVMPSSTASLPPQSIASLEPNRGGNMLGANVPNSNISNDWLGGRTGAVPNGPRGVSPSMPLPTSQLQAPVSMASPVSMGSQPTANASKALAVSGNGFASDPISGVDMFSAISSGTKKEPSGPSYSSSGAPASSAISPVSSGPQPLAKQSSLDSLQSAFSMQPAGGQIPRTQSSFSPSQQVSAQGSSPLASSGISVGPGNSTPDNSQLSWPKMKPSDVQKYTKVFMEVDTDRDGKITGEQARNLFLSWRLPREVLKQVWDLSDQDNDSMLSLREFCCALYMMERYREGRPLPAVLPSNIMYDETLLSLTGQPKVSGPRAIQPNQQKPGAPALEDSFLNQHDTGGQNAANSKPREATTAGEKAFSLCDNKLNEITERASADKREAESLIKKYEEKHKQVAEIASKLTIEEARFRDIQVQQTEILDSKEKLEFYRTKMQELVLYKRRCDNKLNEITERASADKREAESLIKKYEEKHKQVAEIASKLTIEEARFRDIQERKKELHQAIVNMEHGGSSDGILQVRADRLQSDLEELLKALTERCKKHGLDIKSTALIELPIGWEPGIQEGAAVWDEEWDKFEDEGFANDLTLDAKNVSGPSKPQSASVHKEKVSGNGRESTRSFDESTWGAFDNNDDVDSVWGFNPNHTKDSDTEKHKDIFGSNDFGVSPVRTGFSHTESTFQTKSPFSFEDSVPGTPMSKFSNSPRYSDVGDHFFDNSSRFDSFSMHDGGFSPRDKFTRFDSMNSTKDFGRFDSMNTSKDYGRFDYTNTSKDFSRFDSMNSSKDFGRFDSTNTSKDFSRFDSMNTSKDFGYGGKHTRFDSMSSTQDFGYSGEKHTRFDSMSSTKDFGHSSAFSFDEADPFGSSGPFKRRLKGINSISFWALEPNNEGVAFADGDH